MIKLSGLRLAFDTGFLLAVDSLKVRAGEVFAIIGPNGAGKTTLLNAMAMLVRPAAGNLEIMGQDALAAANKLPLRRAMAAVFSQPYLINDTVFNNVALPLRLRGRMDAAAVREALELFRIAHLSERNGRTLSQGESHRAALARAFVTRPKLLLLDEPFASLDERVKESVIQDLRKVIKLSGAAVVLVTQDQAGALTLADTLAVLVGGRILQQGQPQEIFSRPVCKEVADFVGVETILPGRVSANSENLCSVEAGGHTLMAVSGCAAGDSVFFCLRPEDISVSLNADAGGRRNNFKARVAGVAPWGLQYKVELDCGFTAQAAVTKQLVDGLGLKPGAEVYASFKATAAHLIKRNL
ncbi:MAG: ABC transporter ATP-binding protein [Elusimicrobia bacterium HGW-Elusimicrobia-3]|nr:MAG: ABC transporter ATP-binding protein [Elusimicrobia bacterium HGW-Elusimicrobia-3]